jgi:hypothetical protein
VTGVLASALVGTVVAFTGDLVEHVDVYWIDGSLLSRVLMSGSHRRDVPAVGSYRSNVAMIGSLQERIMISGSLEP